MPIPRWTYGPFFIASLTTLAGVVLSARGPIGWGFFVIGVGILAIAALSLILQAQFLKRAHHADGIIIAHKKPVPNEDAWEPVVRYMLPDGQAITFQSHTSTFRIRKSLPVSTKVDVLYDPAHPERARVNTSLEKSGPYAAGLFAIAFLVLGMLMIVGLVPG